MLADFFTKPNENAVEKRYGEKQELIQGRKQDSYNNQSLTGVHGNSLTGGVHGNTNRILKNHWKSQTWEVFGTRFFNYLIVLI